MSRRQRIALLAGTAVAAALGFVALRPDEEDATRPTTDGNGKEGRSQQGLHGGALMPGPARIRLRGGEPLGGVRTISVRRGDVVRLLVSSDLSDEVHVHGYDLLRRVGPGMPARFRFRAKLEGSFEAELEQRGQEIARLEVRP